VCTELKKKKKSSQELVNDRESGRNWWLNGRVEETGGCMGEWKKLMVAQEIGRNW